VTPAGELRALGAFYGTAVDGVLLRHGAALDRYAEWVLGRDGFALVTLGDAASLAAEGSATAAARFLGAAARFPAAILGAKIDPRRHDEPTLYVRTVCPWDDGIAWLSRALELDLSRVPPARTLYGLGFQGEIVKTYSLAGDGFVSWRLDRGGLLGEHKEYRAEVEWSAIRWPDARWAQVGDLGRALGFRTAGHVGTSSGSGELKVYVERVGAIPTDRSFA
jgi:hypothetical protein